MYSFSVCTEKLYTLARIKIVYLENALNWKMSLCQYAVTCCLLAYLTVTVGKNRA